jgi:hypothetical protein
MVCKGSHLPWRHPRSREASFFTWNEGIACYYTRGGIYLAMCLFLPLFCLHAFSDSWFGNISRENKNRSPKVGPSHDVIGVFHGSRHCHMTVGVTIRIPKNPQKFSVVLVQSREKKSSVVHPLKSPHYFLFQTNCTIAVELWNLRNLAT